MSDATVYRVKWSPDRYQALLYDLPEIPDHLLKFDGTSKLDSWTAPPVYVDQPRLDKPDIWQLVGASVIVVSDDVAARLDPFLTTVGELLPVVVTGSSDALFALNILDDIDCLDSLQVIAQELFVPPVFLKHRLPESGLFKVPQLDKVQIFYLERDEDHDSLRRRVEDEGLHGLVFEAVWSAAHGPRIPNLLGR
jgi:hypothetical protein